MRRFGSDTDVVVVDVADAGLVLLGRTADHDDRDVPLQTIVDPGIADHRVEDNLAIHGIGGNVFNLIFERR
ncbi:hypothetical protein D3C76_1440290 [compost metagenome]